MSSSKDIEIACRTIGEKYTVCDVSDALLKLKIPQAGFLADISPLSGKKKLSPHAVVPVSTVLFVPKSHGQHSASNSSIPSTSNIPEGKHWTDCPAPGTIALISQPDGQVCAVCGDILATRLKLRGVKGVIADGRIRDLAAMRELCSEGEFYVWSRASSTVGTGLEAKAWAADVPVRVGDMEVKSGDLLCMDEGEGGCVVIPQEKVEEVMSMLPGLKEADDKCVADVQSGVDVTEAFRRHR